MSLSEPNLLAERRLRAIGWQGQLEQAIHPQDVLSVARDFLAQVSPEEIATLPPETRPERLVDADDIARYAFILAKAEHTPGAPDLLHKLSAFFADASERLSRILAESSND